MTTPWDVTLPGFDVPLDGLKVMLGLPTHRDYPPKTTLSLMQTVNRLNKLSIPWVPAMEMAGCVVDSRDAVLDDFIKSDCNRLFWLDSDQTWTPNQFIRLLALSKLVPIVGATYPAKFDKPTFYVKFDDDVGLVPNDIGLIEVHGIGLGFTIMQREPLEKLVATKPRILHETTDIEMAEVFRWGSINGKRQGEDMAFFSDLRELGYKVFLDPLMDIGHIGVKEYTGSVRDALPSR